jgi:hypothetical protein
MRDAGMAAPEMKSTSVYKGFQIRDGHGIVFVSNLDDIYPSGFLPLRCGNVRKDNLVDVYRDSEIFRGHAGFERWKTRWPSTFDKHEIEPTRFWDAGDQVVVELQERALVAGSSTFVERRFAHIWTFREGAVISIQIFNDPAEALEAAGLSE